jgi:hypothetical protein
MSASFSSRMALGVGFALLAGLSMTVLPTSGTIGTHSSAPVTGAPLSAAPQFPNANTPQCTLKITLVAQPSSVHVGQPFQFVTFVAPIKTTQSAVCPPVTGFQYVNLPYGCMTRNSPNIICTPQLPGVFHTTVFVYAPAAPITASTVVTVS